LKSKKDDEEKRVEAVARLQEIRKELASIEEEFEMLHQQQKYSKTQIED
jgi:Tfp pilus assembly protein PilO